MITIIHGTDTEASRKEYISLQKANIGKEVRVVDGKMLSENALRQALESSSMFSDNLIVCIENLFTPLGKKTTLQKLYAKILNENRNNTLILWEPKELSKTLLTSFPKIQEKNFPLPKILFTFLDAIRPNNTKQMIRLYQELHKQDASELIFYMVSARIRQLIAAKDAVMLPKSNPWTMSRLTNQAKFFTMEQLIMIHSQVLRTEVETKSGLSPLPLSNCIEEILVCL